MTVFVKNIVKSELAVTALTRRYTLIFPLLMIAGVSLVLSMFPSRAESKTYLMLTVILAFLLFEDTVSRHAPLMERLPLLGLYIVSLLGLSIFYFSITCILYPCALPPVPISHLYISHNYAVSIQSECIVACSIIFLWRVCPLSCIRLVNRNSQMT